MIIYFTGTGNSRFAAEYLAEELCDELLDAGRLIKAADEGPLHSDRPWIFVSPTYAWRMANVLADLIRSTVMTGSQEAYFILTCGGEIGNAGEYLHQLCDEKGLKYKGVLEVVMPENYIAMFRVPEEEEAIAIIARAKPVLEQAGALIRQGKDFPLPKVGILDKLKSGIINEGFYKFYVKADAFVATKACIGCGFCVGVCPLNNITLKDGKPIWGGHCTHCMACICGCPTEAIEYGKRSQGKRRYRCPKEA